MKIIFAILLAVLTFLAISSGVTKIALMQQDVEFFGRYGFSNNMLIAFGTAQLIGGMMMPLKRTRFVGAAIVASTFLVSLVILMIDGNVAVSIVTAIAMLLLLIVMKLSWRPHAKDLAEKSGDD